MGLRLLPFLFVPLLQGREVGDDVSDLLVVKSARSHRLLQLRIVLVLAERRHEYAWLHHPRVFDPESEIRGSVREASRPDRRARTEMREVRSGRAHRHGISRNRVTPD